MIDAPLRTFEFGRELE